jgi:hypothetical protein
MPLRHCTISDGGHGFERHQAALESLSARLAALSTVMRGGYLNAYSGSLR